MFLKQSFSAFCSYRNMVAARPLTAQEEKGDGGGRVWVLVGGGRTGGEGVCAFLSQQLAKINESNGEGIKVCCCCFVGAGHGDIYYRPLRQKRDAAAAAPFSLFPLIFFAHSLVRSTRAAEKLREK